MVFGIVGVSGLAGAEAIGVSGGAFVGVGEAAGSLDRLDQGKTVVFGGSGRPATGGLVTSDRAGAAGLAISSGSAVGTFFGSGVDGKASVFGATSLGGGTDAELTWLDGTKLGGSEVTGGSVERENQWNRPVLAGSECTTTGGGGISGRGSTVGLVTSTSSALGIFFASGLGKADGIFWTTSIGGMGVPGGGLRSEPQWKMRVATAWVCGPLLDGTPDMFLTPPDS